MGGNGIVGAYEAAARECARNAKRDMRLLSARKMGGSYFMTFVPVADVLTNGWVGHEMSFRVGATDHAVTAVPTRDSFAPDSVVSTDLLFALLDDDGIGHDVMPSSR